MRPDVNRRLFYLVQFYATCKWLMISPSTGTLPSRAISGARANGYVWPNFVRGPLLFCMDRLRQHRSGTFTSVSVWTISPAFSDVLGLLREFMSRFWRCTCDSSACSCAAALCGTRSRRRVPLGADRGRLSRSHWTRVAHQPAGQLCRRLSHAGDTVTDRRPPLGPGLRTDQTDASLSDDGCLVLSRAPGLGIGKNSAAAQHRRWLSAMARLSVERL